MVQSINIIHPEETLKTYGDYSKYRYNGSEWIKNEKINIDTYVDKSIEDLDIDPTIMGVNDYIELDKKYYNILLQSEGLTNKSIWNHKNVSVNQNSSTFIFPQTTSPAFTIMPSVGDSKVDHLIDQQFVAKLGKSYIYSTFIKDNPTSSLSHKLSIYVKDISYNVLISAEIDLSQEYEFQDDVANLNLKFLEGTNYTEISNINDYFLNYSAKLIRIFDKDNVYYRPFIKFNIKNATTFSVGIIFLNSNSEYKYSILDYSPVYYMSGSQLEIYDDFSIDYPSVYIPTEFKPSQNIIQSKLYTVNSNHQLILLNNKVYYINDVKEGHGTYSEGEQTIKYIKIISSTPTISNPKNGDLAILQSSISFGTVDSDIKNKLYNQWKPNTSYKKDDKVIYFSNLFKCSNAHISSSNFTDDISNWKIVLDAVGLGFQKNIYAPYGSIYYDKTEKIYKIKISTEDGDKWMNLKYNSTSESSKLITRGLTFNQGIFETWNQQSCLIKPVHILGFNTGGNYNFVKLSQISDNL